MPTSSWVHARSHQGLRHRDGQPERSPSPGFGDGNWMRDQPGWGPAWVGTRPGGDPPRAPQRPEDIGLRFVKEAARVSWE